MTALVSRDFAAASIILAAAGAEFLLREQYYLLGAEMPKLLIVLLAWALALAVVAVTGRVLPPAEAGAVRRLTVLAAFVMWVHMVGATTVAVAAGGGLWLEWLWMAELVVLLAGGALAVRAGAEPWAMSRRALCGLCVLFVASQPVVAALYARDIAWPDRGGAAGQAPAGDRPAITLFVLLDELNARSAGPIAEAMGRQGAEVRVRSLRPVGDATGKVVPAMFSGLAFEDAKPCGVDVVCSGTRVLDFSKVHASRKDVDVVGFYEPYCAIQGLRYCVRALPDSPTFDGDRWWCAAVRRVAWLTRFAGSAGSDHCADLAGSVWHGLAVRVEEALWQAPVWQQGGFLYVHLPLPHPPGRHGGESLAQHYDENLRRAAAIVERMARQAQGHGRYRLVVFSDHPLRGQLWCASGQYRGAGCPLDERLVDDRVPLLASGEVPSAFDVIQTNAEVFALAP